MEFPDAGTDPCHVIAPSIEALSLEYEGKVKFVKIDVDEAKKIALSLDIMSIPTIILFNHGKPIARQIGAQPKPILDEMIADTLRETS